MEKRYMETNKEISIIVPIYNVEKYLSRCIDSVLSQDFTEYELILVDDGSPDKCGVICDVYAAKYPNKIKVIHKKNEGLPSARKSGFEISCGRYIMHLDSDDYLLPSALSNLYNKANEGGYDIVKGCNRRFLDDGTYEIEVPYLCGTDIQGSENYLKALIRYDIKPYIWGGIYKRELFENCDYCFTSAVSICEDWITNQAIWQKVHKYIVIPDVVYAYFINPNSMMQSKVLSHQYIDYVGEIMREIANGASNDIFHLIDLDRTVSHIRTFFIPEIAWDSNVYDKISTYCNKKSCLNELALHIDKRFLILVSFKFCFKMYCRTYAYLFRNFKLRGNKRIIL